MDAQMTTRTATRVEPPDGNAHVNPTRGRRRALTVVSAVAAAVVVWIVAQGAGVAVESPRMGEDPPAAIGLGATLLAAAVSSLAGWGLLEVFERRWPARAMALWRIAASVVFVGSLGAPVTGEGIGTSTRVVLVALHVAVAAVLAAGFARTTRWDWSTERS